MGADVGENVDIEVHDPRPRRRASRKARRLHQASNFMAFVLIGLGLAVVVRTSHVAGWSFAVGYLYGVLVMAAGIARLYLGRRLGGDR